MSFIYNDLVIQRRGTGNLGSQMHAEESKESKLTELRERLRKLKKDKQEYLDGDEEIEEECVDAFDIDIDNLRNELTNLVKELQKKK
jgi:adenylate kinase